MPNSCEAVIAYFAWFNNTCGAEATHTFVYAGKEYHSCDEHLPQEEIQ